MYRGRGKTKPSPVEISVETEKRVVIRLDLETIEAIVRQYVMDNYITTGKSPEPISDMPIGISIDIGTYDDPYGHDSTIVTGATIKYLGVIREV